MVFKFRKVKNNTGFQTLHLQDSDYIGLGLEKGYLKLTYSLLLGTCDTAIIQNSSTFFSKSIPHVGFLADGEWHTIILKMRRENITVTVDETQAYFVEPGILNHEKDTELFIGKISLFIIFVLSI